MTTGVAITTISDVALQRLDAEACRLTRGARQRDRLRLGDAFAALDEGVREHGFRSFSAYVRERVGLDVRWCCDTRALSRRLRDLPQIRRALRAGAIDWCKAELLARHATAEDEEELLETCRGATIRAARRILKERGEEVEPEPDVEERFASLDITVPLEHAVALEVVRQQVEHVNGGPGEPGSWLECLLMESHTTLLELAPEAFARSEDVAAALRGWIEARWRAEQRNVEAEERARPVAVPSVDEVAEEEGALPLDPVALDRVIREIAKRIASRDVWLGRVLDRLFRARAWSRLGYATETQYAQDRFGMSRSAVRRLITRTRRAEWLDGLEAAIQDGRVYPMHASAIARVATPDTLEAWITRATRRTYKHLLEEVRLAELLTRVGDDDPIEPPSDEEMAEWQRTEAEWLSGAFLERWSAAMEAEDAATVSAPVEMLEVAGDEPYRQYGEHIDEVEAALAAILARREGAQLGIEEGAGPTSVGSAAESQLETPAGPTSVGAATESAEARTNVPAVPAFEGSAGVLDALAGSSAGPRSAGARVQPRADEQELPASVGSAVAPVESRTEVAAVPTSVGSAAERTGVSAELAYRAREAAQRHRGRRRLATTTQRVVVRQDVALFYRELETVFDRSGLPGTFVELLLVDFWRSWRHLFDVGNKWKHIHDRDRHQCCCPVCLVKRSLANHHLRYRSHGGGDEPSNQITACDFCHLDGEHGGRLRVRGTAERPTWWLGRTPILRVEGREKIELNDRAGAA